MKSTTGYSDTGLKAIVLALFKRMERELEATEKTGCGARARSGDRAGARRPSAAALIFQTFFQTPDQTIFLTEIYYFVFSMTYYIFIFS